MAVESASKLFYLVADPVTAHWLTYLQMVEHIMRAVRSGKDVCVAFYGHPGVFSFPPHQALRIAKAEGYMAKMLPGISSEDCLMADLGLDPSTSGCQSFEGSDFLINHRRYDDTSLLVLWQIGEIGQSALPMRNCDRRPLRVLTSRLEERYSASHKVKIYEAAIHGEPIAIARLL